MREFWSKLRNVRRPRAALDDDLREEMQAHLELMAEEERERGLADEEARYAARRRFGNQTATRELARQAWQFPRIESVAQDVRYALRGMRAKPAFWLLVILTLALGIGANTALFSVVYAVLLRPLPYPAGERLLELGESTPKAQGISVTWINLEHWRAESHCFEGMAGFHTADVTLTGRGDAVLTHAAVVSSGFFQLTGQKPLLGRFFTQPEDRPSAVPSVVVSEQFWRRTLGGDPGALAAALDLNGKPYQIIGVVRSGHDFFLRPVDFYLPLGEMEGNTVKRSDHRSIRALARLKPGVTLQAARADLDAIMQRLAQADPGPEDDHRAYAEYLTESRVGDVRQTLVLLMGAVALVLLLASANVASLLLVRSAARGREMAIRTAIGAGTARLARQLLTETLVTSAIGGALGILLAAWGLRALRSLGPIDIPRLAEAGLNVNVLAFTAAITIAAGALAGLAPIFTARRIDLTQALKDGSPGSGRGRSLFRNALVVGEIAITLVLAFGSGLLLRSLMLAQNSYPGFEDADHLLALEMQLPSSRYKTDASTRDFYNRLTRDLRGEPGVTGVASVVCPPSAGDCGDWWYSIREKPAPARADVPLTLTNIADASYFRVMGMRLAAGRGFTDADRAGGPPVVVINQELARSWWRAPQLAIGNHLKLGGPYMDGPVAEIVGVVANVKQMGLDADPLPEIYSPFAQRPSGAMVVMIRSSADPAMLMPQVRRTLASVDRNVPIQSLKPFDAWLGATLQRRRFSTLLLTLFAALAIALAGVGVYGVLNHWVGTRQRDIAVRVALGAQQSAIARWAGGHAMRLAAMGIALGAIGAWEAARWLESMVFGVAARSPMMLALSGLAVLLIAAAAAGAPVWRATRADVVRSLHDA